MHEKPPFGAVCFGGDVNTADGKMTLLAILIGTLVAGIGSVWLAAWLSFGVISRYTQHMLSLAAGALLATAFLHLLPEAFEAGVAPQALFLTLLLGLVFFFLLDKAELWHHGHEHHHGHGEADHAHQHRRREHAAVQVEARREVRHVDHIARRILHTRLQDRRIALVKLAHRVAALEQQVDEAECVGSTIFFVGPQQAATQRIAVEMRIAPPCNARVTVDQGAGSGITNQAEIEMTH